MNSPDHTHASWAEAYRSCSWAKSRLDCSPTSGEHGFEPLSLPWTRGTSPSLLPWKLAATRCDPGKKQAEVSTSLGALPRPDLPTKKKADAGQTGSRIGYVWMHPAETPPQERGSSEAFAAVNRSRGLQ